MNPTNFSFLVRLPNREVTKIILDEAQRDNYVPQKIVDLLLQRGEIIVEGNQALVEFDRHFRVEAPLTTDYYYDGAWCTIDPSRSHLTLGQTWMEKRQVTIDPDQSICVVRPPHIGSNFYFPKYISRRLKPVLPEKVVTKDEPIIADVWDQELLVQSGLDLVDDSIFTFDSTFEVVTATKIDDTLFAVVNTPLDALLFRESSFVDRIWSDFCAAHDDRQLDVPDMIVCVELHAHFLALVFIILRHFKIRGRIFSNRGRMMGIEMHGTRGARLGTPDTGRRTQLTEDEQRQWRHVFIESLL